MPTRKIHLTDPQAGFVEEVVRAGKYETAADPKLDPLRTQLQAGLDALDNGRFTEVDDAHLDAALDDVAVGRMSVA